MLTTNRHLEDFVRLIRGQKSRPIYGRITSSLISAIEQKIYQGDDFLPTQRELAEALGWPLSTVTRGYRECVEKGLIRTGRRNGSRVLAPGRSVRHLDAHVVPDELERPVRFDLTRQAIISPIYAAQVRHCLNELASNSKGVFSNLRYSSHQLNSEPKSILAEYFSRHYKHQFVDADAILSAGAQNALISLLFAAFAPGDTVGCEEYTYRGLRYAAKVARIDLVPIRIDEKGLVPEDFLEKVLGSQLKGLVCVPNYQNPTARTLPETRRQSIVAIAERHGVLIVEDDVYGLLAQNGIPTMHSMYPEGTFLINSFSKALGPGLRVGIIFAPRKYVIPVSAAIRATTWMPSQIDLAIISAMISNGEIDKIVADNQRILGERVVSFAKIFAEQDVSFGAYCPHATIKLSSARKANFLTEWLRSESIYVESSEQFAIQSVPQEFIRVNLTGLYTDKGLIQALGKISAALAVDIELL